MVILLFHFREKLLLKLITYSAPEKPSKNNLKMLKDLRWYNEKKNELHGLKP